MKNPLLSYATNTVIWQFLLTIRFPRPFARSVDRFNLGASFTKIRVIESLSTSKPLLCSAFAMADTNNFFKICAAFLG
jgi:hypothetical protein